MEKEPLPANPYVRLSLPLLEAMTRQPLYLVRQYYWRGIDPDENTNSVPLLLTHYIHHEVDRERAQRHMRLLKKDPYRFLYDSTDPEHLLRLQAAAGQPEGFRIYINLLASPWKAGDPLKQRINAYVAEQLPWWGYRSSGKLQVTLKDRYGEFFLAITWKHQQTEVNLADIENYRSCAMT